MARCDGHVPRHNRIPISISIAHFRAQWCKRDGSYHWARNCPVRTRNENLRGGNVGKRSGHCGYSTSSRWRTIPADGCTELDCSDLDSWKSFLKSELGSYDYHSLRTPVSNGVTFTMAVHAGAQDGAISAQTSDLHNLVFRHMVAALRLAENLPRLLEGPRAQILIGSTGQVIQINEAATSILCRYDGLDVRNGELRCHRRSDRKLRAAIALAASALETGGATTIISVARADGGLPYILRVTPVARVSAPFGGLVEGQLWKWKTYALTSAVTLMF